MPKFVVDWSSWIVASAILFFDSVATAVAFAIPLYFFDPKYLLEKGSWIALGCTVGLVALKTLGVAFHDFKKYVRQVED